MPKYIVKGGFVAYQITALDLKNIIGIYEMLPEDNENVPDFMKESEASRRRGFIHLNPDIRAQVGDYIVLHVESGKVAAYNTFDFLKLYEAAQDTAPVQEQP